MEREHACARRAIDLVEKSDQAFEGKRLTVLVPAQMRVRIDDLPARRHELLQLCGNRRIRRLKRNLAHATIISARST